MKYLPIADDFFETESLAPMIEGKPRSVFEALEVMPDDKWNEMCGNLFPKILEIIDIDHVIDRIKETNTCTGTNPVEVWIDRYGNFRIKVWR